MLSGQLNHIARDPALREAWKGRNLETLIARSQPVLAELKSQFGITKFSFVAPDRTCLLRVHEPERRGDLIDRSTMLTAARIGVDARGMEFGVPGDFTLRYVRPWTQDGRIAGYLELGMEVENRADMLAKDLQVDFVLVIHKKHTSREESEAGKQALGFAGEWDDFPDLIVVSQSLPTLPDELVGRKHFCDLHPESGREAFKEAAFAVFERTASRARRPMWAARLCVRRPSTWRRRARPATWPR